jgi:predicted alpha/beta-fold hydrolase
MMNYAAPLWLPGGHLQTIWPALYGHRPTQALPAYQRERWCTPDDDFIDVDRLPGQPGQPLLVLFHGLEGSSSSHYAQAFADFSRQRNFAFAVPHFRGCSGELNRGPRAYHSGDFEEIGWILARLRSEYQGPILAVGVSLGGNALLRWAEELGAQAARCLTAMASVSAPLDLAASGRAIGRGFNRLVYTRRFLSTMKPRALQKLAQYPGLFKAEALRAARDLYEFDNVFTAPLHGFKNTDDYWERASAKPQLQQIRIPALLVNACNDPFVPADCLPQSTTGDWVTLWQPQQGGHVGFSSGPFPGHIRALPQIVGGWLADHINALPAQDVLNG